mmetsp:Transcript_285/g.405  ORF Transcript_285/g.405 Transcript_285/m.405 type:complete len:209 (-) Transcript_285:40-666(-)
MVFFSRLFLVLLSLSLALSRNEGTFQPPMGPSLCNYYEISMNSTLAPGEEFVSYVIEYYDWTSGGQRFDISAAPLGSGNAKVDTLLRRFDLGSEYEWVGSSCIVKPLTIEMQPPSVLVTSKFLGSQVIKLPQPMGEKSVEKGPFQNFVSVDEWLVTDDPSSPGEYNFFTNSAYPFQPVKLTSGPQSTYYYNYLCHRPNLTFFSVPSFC